MAGIPFDPMLFPHEESTVYELQGLRKASIFWKLLLVVFFPISILLAVFMDSHPKIKLWMLYK